MPRPIQDRPNPAVRFTLLAILLALPLLVPAGLHGQDVQVPLDEAGDVRAIDARLAGQLGLFLDEHPGFESALLYRLPDGSYSLEIVSRRNGERVRIRQPLTAAAAAALRENVSARMQARAPRVALGQDGRFLLLGQTTLLGVGFYGWAVPESLGVEGGAAYAGTYLLTAAGSFFLPFMLTQDQPVTFGMANLSRSGAMRGVGHGALLYHLLTGPDPEDFEAGLARERARLGTMVLTSLGEGVGGYLWARSEDMDPGRAATIANGADLGQLWGMGLSGVSGEDDFSRRGPAGLALAGAAAGVWAGSEWSARRDYTWGDANVMRTGGAVGILSGLALADAVAGGESAVYWGGALLGSAAGAIVADRMVDGLDFSVGQSVLVQLGTLAGGLTGLGVAALVEAETTGLLISSAVGAAAGFGLTYAALADDARNGGDGWLVDLRVSPVVADLERGLRPGATLQGTFSF